MASLRRLLFFKTKAICLSNIKSRDIIFRLYAAHWNKDWKPGKFPTTPEEREAAARKYGLRPEDYSPYPDDGFGYGDYPKLPDISIASRDPYEDWDLPMFKRNYGEPLPVNADILREDCMDPQMWKPYSFRFMLTFLLSFLGVLWGIYLLLEPYPHHNPVLPKQYPRDGKHYTFKAAH